MSSIPLPESVAEFGMTPSSRRKVDEFSPVGNPEI